MANGQCNSSGEGSTIMIKNDAQRDRTVAQIEGFRQALAKVARRNGHWGSYQSMIRQLEDELREYNQLKSGELTLTQVERLDQIAPRIAKIRIARGVSQTELARRLGGRPASVATKGVNIRHGRDRETTADSGRTWSKSRRDAERMMHILGNVLTQNWSSATDGCQRCSAPCTF